jgi:CheY-like chemotaxis protein
LLEINGYECVTTWDGREALRILRTESIDSEIQDLMRPVISGIQMLLEMKADDALRSIPVLMTTPAAIEKVANLFRQHGLSTERDLAGYLKMPCSPIELLEMVEAILEKHTG